MTDEERIDAVIDDMGGIRSAEKRQWFRERLARLLAEDRQGREVPGIELHAIRSRNAERRRIREAVDTPLPWQMTDLGMRTLTGRLGGCARSNVAFVEHASRDTPCEDVDTLLSHIEFLGMLVHDLREASSAYTRGVEAGKRECAVELVGGLG